MDSSFKEENLFRSITRLSRAARRYASNGKECLRHIDTLRVCLLNNGTLSLGELAVKLDIRPPSLSEWVDKLAESGEITKARCDGDKRVIHCSLTDKGREAAKEAEEKMLRSNDALNGCLSAEERQSFMRLCEKLYNHIHAEIEARDNPLEGCDSKK